MKTLSLFLFLLTSPVCKEPSTVYICNSGKTLRYHYTAKCRGLSNCNYKIVKTTLEKAQKDKKTLCKWEE